MPRVAAVGNSQLPQPLLIDTSSGRSTPRRLPPYAPASRHPPSPPSPAASPSAPPPATPPLRRAPSRHAGCWGDQAAAMGFRCLRNATRERCPRAPSARGLKPARHVPWSSAGYRGDALADQLTLFHRDGEL